MVSTQNELTIIASDELIEEHNKVEFRLLYAGELPPSGNQTRRGEIKHKIRRAFHPQLRRLWDVNPNLRQLACNQKFVITPKRLSPGIWSGILTEQERFDLGLIHLGKNWERVGYNFIPLVTEEMVLRCSLDILLLRPGDKKHIYHQGDIDGQLKTLFDALRIPTNAGDLGEKNAPIDDENPFFCLLEDDRLITEVHVKTDELLLLPGHKEIKANEAFAVIDVQLNHKNARTFDNYFG
jgi:hypothetical protein